MPHFLLIKIVEHEVEQVQMYLSSHINSSHFIFQRLYLSLWEEPTFNGTNLGWLLRRNSRRQILDAATLFVGVASPLQALIWWNGIAWYHFTGYLPHHLTRIPNHRDTVMQEIFAGVIFGVFAIFAFFIRLVDFNLTDRSWVDAYT